MISEPFILNSKICLLAEAFREMIIDSTYSTDSDAVGAPLVTHPTEIVSVVVGRVQVEQGQCHVIH